VRCFTGRCASLAAPRLPHASPARSPLPLSSFWNPTLWDYRASLDTNWVKMKRLFYYVIGQHSISAPSIQKRRLSHAFGVRGH